MNCNCRTYTDALAWLVFMCRWNSFQYHNLYGVYFCLFRLLLLFVWVRINWNVWCASSLMHSTHLVNHAQFSGNCEKSEQKNDLLDYSLPLSCKGNSQNQIITNTKKNSCFSINPSITAQRRFAHNKLIILFSSRSIGMVICMRVFVRNRQYISLSTKLIIMKSSSCLLHALDCICLYVVYEFFFHITVILAIEIERIHMQFIHKMTYGYVLHAQHTEHAERI